MQENEKSPQKLTINDAKAFVRFMRKRTGTQSLNLPTLEQLKIAQQTNQIVMMGKEWTQEGWIYDPILQKVNKHPKSQEVAAFRLVDNTSAESPSL